MTHHANHRNKPMNTETEEDNKIRWVSGNDFVEHQTKEFAKRFTSSRPRPRNKAMGFKGSDKPKRKTQ